MSELDYKENWAPKKWSFWTVVLKKTPRVAWTARRSNQSTLKENNPEYSLEGLMLKPKVQCFGHLIQRTNSLEKTLMLGKIEGGRRRGRQDEMVGWHYQLDGRKCEQVQGFGYWKGSLACCTPWGHKISDMTDWAVAWKRLGSIASKYILLLIFKYPSLNEYFLGNTICNKLKLSLERRPYK